MQTNTKEYIQAKMAAVRAMCDTAMAERGSAPSIVLCYDKGGRERLLEASFNGPLHRRQVLTGLQMYFAAWGVESYIFVSEAWVITRSAEQMRERHVQPSQAEDRRELLMILGVTRDGIAHHAAEIRREPDGRVWLDDSIMAGHEGMESMGGELTELLPPPEIGLVPANLFQKFELMREKGLIILNLIDDGQGGEDATPTIMGEANPRVGHKLDEFIRSATEEPRVH